LNADYFQDGIGHLRRMEQQVSAPTLFDLLATADGAGDEVAA
jgi:hypothetical protein